MRVVTSQTTAASSTATNPLQRFELSELPFFRAEANVARGELTLCARPDGNTVVTITADGSKRLATVDSFPSAPQTVPLSYGDLKAIGRALEARVASERAQGRGAAAAEYAEALEVLQSPLPALDNVNVREARVDAQGQLYVRATINHGESVTVRSAGEGFEAEVSFEEAGHRRPSERYPLDPRDLEALATCLYDHLTYDPARAPDLGPALGLIENALGNRPFNVALELSQFTDRETAMDALARLGVKLHVHSPLASEVGTLLLAPASATESEAAAASKLPGVEGIEPDRQNQVVDWGSFR